jgi:hypothetical protein
MIDDVIRKAQESSDGPTHGPSRLKSRILSSLISLEQSEGPLRILSETRDDGESLCVFEHAVAMLPSENLQSWNPCAVCHARILGERVENAPIYWPGCPYARFCGH